MQTRPTLNLRGSVAKLAEAYALLRDCFGGKGVWASPDRYRNTCWTRDFAYAICPALCLMGEFAAARNHLEHLIARQRADGSMPILFLDDEAAWVQGKIAQEMRSGREPFMLRRYREGAVEDLTPGTRDSEICFLVAMFHYAEQSGDRAFIEDNWAAIDKALAYVETRLMEDGLALGCDWRDTMHEELGRTALLSNNALLLSVYEALEGYAPESARGIEAAAKAAQLSERVKQAFRGPDEAGFFYDTPEKRRVDPLGLAFWHLRLMCDDGSAVLVDACRTVDSPYGVTIKCRHKPGGLSHDDEAEVIERTDGVVVWPFVVGLTALAALETAQVEFALDQFQKLHDLPGFYEWYDSRTGKGYGAPRQLWSAALYIRAFFAFHDTGRIGPA